MPEVFLSAFFIFVDITKNIGSQLHKKNATQKLSFRIAFFITVFFLFRTIQPQFSG